MNISEELSDEFIKRAHEMDELVTNSAQMAAISIYQIAQMAAISIYQMGKGLKAIRDEKLPEDFVKSTSQI